MKSNLIAWITLLFWAGVASAQTETDDRIAGRKTLFDWGRFAATDADDEPADERDTITTDRPDFTEASSTVGRGVYQIEAGYTYTYDRSGSSSRLHSWGEPLLRAGVFDDWLEFRIAAFPLTQILESGASQQADSGFGDLYLGFKVALTPQRGLFPESAIIPQMRVPTGSAAFSNDSVLCGANYLYSWSLTERCSLAGSTQFNRAVDPAGKEYTEWAQSLSLGRSLTENLSAYSEFYALLPNHAIDVKPAYYYDGGFTYLLSDDIQWDIRAGVGLNEAADDFFVGSGLSFRFRPARPAELD